MNSEFGAELQSKLDRLEETIQGLISHLTNVKNENRDLKEEINRLRSSTTSVDSYRKEIEELKASRVRAGEKIETLIKRLNELPLD